MRRLVCDVMRPATAKSSRGQERGKDTTIIRNWPCSIVALGGNEVESAGSTYADSTFEIGGFGDPSKPIRSKDYLLLKDGSGRRFDISHVMDIKQNGRELLLTCGERVGEVVSG